MKDHNFIEEVFDLSKRSDRARIIYTFAKESIPSSSNLILALLDALVATMVALKREDVSGREFAETVFEEGKRMFEVMNRASQQKNN